MIDRGTGTSRLGRKIGLADGGTRRLRAVLIAAVGLLALAAPSRVVAAHDIFLQIAGLNGESADEQFAGAFEAVSATSGVGMATTSGGGSGTGRPTFSPVVVKLRRPTAGSPGLEEAATTGNRFPQAVVSFRRAGEGAFVFLTYTLTDVTVTSFKREASAAEDAPTEEVSLTYTQIRTDYQGQNADGSPGPVVSVCWDVQTNARCPEQAPATK